MSSVCNLASTALAAGVGPELDATDLGVAASFSLLVAAGEGGTTGLFTGAGLCATGAVCELPSGRVFGQASGGASEFTAGATGTGM